MPGTPQARTPAKGTSGPHPVRRRAAARTVKSPGASPTSHHRAGPSTPPSGAKGKLATVSGGGGGHDAALHHRRAVTQSAGAHPSSAPPPSQEAGTEEATTPLNPYLLTGKEAMSFPTAAGVVDAELRSDPRSPSVRFMVDTLTKLENGSLLSSPAAAARAMSLSSASLLSSTRALEGDVCDAAESRDTVRGALDDEDIDAVITERAAALQASCGVQSGTTSDALPVTPERPVQVRFFRCAKPLLMTTQGLQQQVVVSNEPEEDDEEQPRVALGPRDAAAVDKSSLSATLPLPLENENGHGEQEEEEEAEGEPTALEPRVPDMNTTLLGDDEEGEVEQAMECVESSAVPCAPHQHDALSTAATTAGEPTAEPYEEAAVATEEAAVPQMVSADVSPPRRRTPVLTSNELHPALPLKNGTQPSLLQRTVRARLTTDPDDDLEAELMCDMSVPTTPTSSNSSFADSRASSNGSFSDSSDNAVLQRVNTAAPASLPRRSAGPSGDELHSSERLVHPPMRKVPSPSPSYTDAAGAAVIMEKRISLSSARGQSGSCGCTEGMTSPASHRTRRSTPRMEEEEGGTEEGRRSASPIVVAPPQTGGDDDDEGCGADSPSPADPADVIVENADAGSLAVVPLTAVRIRLNRKAQKLHAEKREEEEEELGRASQSAVYHARFVPSARDARHRIWKAALVSLEALVVEYEESLLTCVMQANAAAWLPSQPVTGLHHVNKAAMYPALPPAAKKMPAAAPPPPSATQDPFRAALAQKGEGDSEMQLLFQLFAAAPSDSSRAHLCSTFFAQQLSRYHNWVRHLQFEFLYVRIVAVRAMCMLEMHERRLTCMRRDLGVRDKIELFMLLAPRPRAPTLTPGRGVFSAFRMALHTLGGGDGQRQSRTGSSSSKARGASTSRKPPPPATQARRTAPAQAVVKAVPSLVAPPRSSAARPDDAALHTFKPLFASERCRSGKYAVPVVSELSVSPGNLHSRGVSPATADRTASAATEEGEKDVAQPAMREVLWTADPPRDAASHHRGVPRPLNKTYSDYYKKVAERKGESTPVFGELHLPRLLRTSSRTSSASRRNSASQRCEASQPATHDANGEAPPTEKRQTGRSGAAKEDELEMALQRLGQRFSSSTRHSRSPKRRRDTELPGGRLRAKERVAAKPRKRTPPPPPTEADFVDLRDDVALRRFL